MAKLLEKHLKHIPVRVFDHHTKHGDDAWQEYRIEHGRSKGPLLTQPTDNMKLAKSGIPTYGVSLAPHSISGWNVCPKSTPTCRAGCVAYSGNGGFKSVMGGRVLRTTFLQQECESFVHAMVYEIDKAVAKHGFIHVRLNVFSDLPWHTIAPQLFTRWGDSVAFYDYTKVWDRAGVVPSNWHLTLSVSERTSDGDILTAAHKGYNVAMVFDTSRTKMLPIELGVTEGRNVTVIPVVDGDISDNRIADPQGVIVGLRAKGTMRRDIGKSAMIHTTVDRSTSGV